MIDIKEITNGKLDGQKVWICDFRYDDYGNKPIRNIQPQLVLVRSNNETTKRIYYSKSHFVGLNKNGKPLKSKIIAPFDNTGYRFIGGTPLNVFYNEEDCVQCYKEQLKIAIEGLTNYKDKISKVIDSKIEELKNYGR